MSPQFPWFLASLAVVLAFITAMVPIIAGFRRAHRDREWTHLERMRALELGQQYPEDGATARVMAAFGHQTEPTDRGSLARKCYSTAIWVAFWGFVCASSQAGVGWRSGVAEAIALSVGAVGVTAVICGTLLALRTSEPAFQSGMTKPIGQEDAFDVVASRGH